MSDCDPTACSLPGSSVHGTPQARILELVSISYSGDPSDSGIEPTSFASPALAGGVFTTNATWEACFLCSPLLQFFEIDFYWSIVDLQCCVSAIQLSESVTHIHKSTLF